MAATTKQPKANEVANKTSNEPKKRTKQKNKAAQKQEEVETKRAGRIDPDQIAAACHERTLAGNFENARLLAKFKPQDKLTQPVVKKRPGLTSAQQLALCPPWQGDLGEDFFDADDPKP